MRRLPVFVCADVSESMAGNAISALQNGIGELLFALRKDPQVIEVGAISIISFGCDAKVEIPLSSVLDVFAPTFELSSGTSLGKAFELLTDEMHANVKKTTTEVRGDYKPIVFLITDGQPTDDWRRGVAKFRKAYPTVVLHAIGCGEDVDFSVLKEITPHTYTMADVTGEAFGKLFQCVSASVRSVSASFVSGENAQDDLTFWNGDLIRKPTEAECRPVSEPCQILIPAVCSKTAKPYLVRYRKDEKGQYKFVASHPLERKLKGDGASGGNITVSRLDSTGVTCPHCENNDVFYCNTCWEWVCMRVGDRKGKCPDCGWSGELVSGIFDLSRARG